MNRLRDLGFLFAVVAILEWIYAINRCVYSTEPGALGDRLGVER
jgi:hypothetical protein